jgi:hypothetical protein
MPGVMTSPAVRFVRQVALRLAPLSLLAVLLAPPARSQTFAVGAAGSLLNDTGTAAHLRGFDFAAGHLFVEMSLEPGVLFQVRGSVFTLPGGIPRAPHVPTDSVTLSVAYLFGEEWWQAGFIGGVGGYRLAPEKPGPGDEFYDDRETAVGFHGGVLGIFAVNRRWDVRLEGTIHTIRTDVKHTPIFITAGVAYHF